jgi:hypothetical protein
MRIGGILSALFSCLMPLTVLATSDFRSTELNADGSVTFHFYEPHAARVDLVLENRADRVAMQKSADGVWTVTTSSLRPEIYGYRFAIDGQARTVHDPQNQLRRYGNDLLLIPGKPPQPWEEAGSPRGHIRPK